MVGRGLWPPSLLCLCGQDHPRLGYQYTALRAGRGTQALTCLHSSTEGYVIARFSAGQCSCFSPAQLLPGSVNQWALFSSAASCPAKWLMSALHSRYFDPILQVLEDHARPVLSLAVSGTKLFSGSYDYTIKVGCALCLRCYLALSVDYHVDSASRSFSSGRISRRRKVLGLQRCMFGGTILNQCAEPLAWAAQRPDAPASRTKACSSMSGNTKIVRRVPARQTEV